MVATPQQQLAQMLADVDELVTLRDAAGRAATERLLADLQAADRNLAVALAGWVKAHGGPTGRFTEASLVAYRRQVLLAQEYVNQRLLGHTQGEAMRAIGEAVERTGAVLSVMEKSYAMVTRPLRVRQAAMMDSIRRGTGASLLQQHATSVDRYGTAMIGQFEQTLRIGMMQGASQRTIVEALTGHGGPRGEVSMAAREILGEVHRLRVEDIPEGLFVRHRYWATRIVRTEFANAYNAAGTNTIQAAREVDFPDMQKKIIAFFDNRTAMDSVYVHGQVRPVDGLFEDGAGRQYLHPPARPNDRETVIPWRPAWPETEITRQRTLEEQHEAQERAAGRRGEAAELKAERRAQLAARRRTEQAQERADRRMAQQAQAQPPAGPQAAAAHELQALRGLPYEQARNAWNPAAGGVFAEGRRSQRPESAVAWSDWADRWVGSSSDLRAAVVDYSLGYPRRWYPMSKKSARSLVRGMQDLPTVAAGIRQRYALTQVELERARVRRQEAGAGGEARTLTLYRGIKGKQADGVRRAHAAGEAVSLQVRGVSSWTTDRAKAAQFARNDGGVVVEAEVPFEQVLAHHHHETILRNMGEAEVVVLANEHGAVRVAAVAEDFAKRR